jgi:outer membrane protein assembly factor BamB
VIVQADGHKQSFIAAYNLFASTIRSHARSCGALPITTIVYGELFYVLSDNGVFSAYEVKTGTVVYQQRLPTSLSASPVAADGRLYLASEDGDVFVVKAGRQYELLSRNTMGQALMATPALSQGMLIVRGEHAIYPHGRR